MKGDCQRNIKGKESQTNQKRLPCSKTQTRIDPSKQSDSQQTQQWIPTRCEESPHAVLDLIDLKERMSKLCLSTASMLILSQNRQRHGRLFSSYLDHQSIHSTEIRRRKAQTVRRLLANASLQLTGQQLKTELENVVVSMNWARALRISDTRMAFWRDLADESPLRGMSRRDG